VAGGSGRTTSDGSNSSASTWPSSTTSRAPAVFVYPALETMVAPLAPFRADSGAEQVAAVRVWDHVKDRVGDYLTEYGRPEQIAAWRDGQPYVADMAENSAGR
jgi:hypothetical protein